VVTCCRRREVVEGRKLTGRGRIEEKEVGFFSF
jgi:hypothetical protein